MRSWHKDDWEDIQETLTLLDELVREKFSYGVLDDEIVYEDILDAEFLGET